jgi:hypothetical protein
MVSLLCSVIRRRLRGAPWERRVLADAARLLQVPGDVRHLDLQRVAQFEADQPRGRQVRLHPVQVASRRLSD